MSVRNRQFLKLLDYSPNELERLLQSALTLKQLKHCGHARPILEGSNLALLFDSDCQQSRWTAASAVASLGGTLTVLEAGHTGLGKNDDLNCSGQLLGRLFEGLLSCGCSQERVEDLARISGIPVCNLGSEEFQPVKVLATLLTMRERAKEPLSELSVTLIGDASTEFCRSLMVGASKFGLDLRICGPKGLDPDELLLETCLALASETGGQIRLFREAEEAAKGADFVLTHSWLQSATPKWDKKVKKLLPFRATTELLSYAGHGRCQLIHHLPVVLGEDTDLAAKVQEKFELDGLEVSRELFESTSNLSFEQSENQLFTLMAALISILQ